MSLNFLSNNCVHKNFTSISFWNENQVGHLSIWILWIENLISWNLPQTSWIGEFGYSAYEVNCLSENGGLTFWQKIDSQLFSKTLTSYEVYSYLTYELMRKFDAAQWLLKTKFQKWQKCAYGSGLQVWLFCSVTSKRLVRAAWWFDFSATVLFHVVRVVCTVKCSFLWHLLIRFLPQFFRSPLLPTPFPLFFYLLCLPLPIHILFPFIASCNPLSACVINRWLPQWMKHHRLCWRASGYRWWRSGSVRGIDNA